MLAGYMAVFGAMFVTLLIAPVLPSNGRVLFSLGHDNGRIDDREIYALDIDRTILHRLTYSPNGDFQPDVSSDGRYITFISRRNGTPEVFVMTSSGRNPRRLFPGVGDIANPSWSPDGQTILFQQTGDGSTEIMQVDFATGEVQALTDTAYFNSDASWSPDGSHIAFHSNRSGRGEIFIMDADGSNVQQLTYSSDFWSRNPQWSPDGSQIAFSSYASETSGSWDIYVMNPEGGEVRQVSNADEHDENPTWSPDGKSLLFESPRGMRWMFAVDVEETIQNSEAGQPLYAADRYLYRLLRPLFRESDNSQPIVGSVGHLFPDWAK